MRHVRWVNRFWFHSSIVCISLEGCVRGRQRNNKTEDFCQWTWCFNHCIDFLVTIAIEIDVNNETAFRISDKTKGIYLFLVENLGRPRDEVMTPSYNQVYIRNYDFQSHFLILFLSTGKIWKHSDIFRNSLTIFYASMSTYYCYCEKKFNHSMIVSLNFYDFKFKSNLRQ